MSRCFPYPRPGYSGEQGSSQALIDSIKLQRERELAKAEAKKDRKREKKERRKRKKEHKKEPKKKHKKDELKTSLLPEKKIHKKSSTVLKNGTPLKLLPSENEQFERSSLTEEHAQPAAEQKPSTSSDSTQNSSKRKRESSPPAVARQEENSIRSNGNVIRIRLSSQKVNTVVSKQNPRSTTFPRTELPLQKQSALISRQEPCSTSGRTDKGTTSNNNGGQVDISSVQPGNNNVFRVCPPRPEAVLIHSASVPKSFTREDNPAVVKQTPDNELPKGSVLPRHDRKVCTTLGGPKAITPEDDVAICDTKSVSKKAISLKDDIAVRDPKSLNKKLVKAELRYRDLFMKWIPPPLQMELACEDQDWLFGKKRNPDNQNDKKLKPSCNVVCGSNTSSWPHAQFIPEADIYALPFTVPF